MKNLIAIITVFLGTLLIKAQQSNSFGVRAGTTITALRMIDDSGTSELNSDPSFYAGGFWEYSVNNNFGLQIGASFVNLDAKIDFSEDLYGEEAQKIDMNFNYISVPIAAKYYANKSFSVMGGFNFDFLMSSNVKTIYKGETETEDLKEQLKSTSLSTFIGAEYILYKGLFAEAKYNFGLSDIDKDKEDGVKIKLNYFQLGLGYKF